MTFPMNQIFSNILFLGLALLAIGACEAFVCPSHCSCTELQPDHAKCTSLMGLRQLGKTSELHSLDLSSLNLTKITNQLEKFTNLSILDLHNNNLSEISSLSLKRIRKLDLSRNRITSGKLTKIPVHVKYLNLSHNDITILTENFKQFVHLESLELAHNPLNCTCETLYIRDWLQEKKVWTDTPIQCTAPLNYKGLPWLQVPRPHECDSNDSVTHSPRMSSYSEDENELMMGDDPNNNIENEFLPVSEDSLRYKQQNVSEEDNENISNQSDSEEGSGADETESPSIINYNEVYKESSSPETVHNNDLIEILPKESTETYPDEKSTDKVLPETSSDEESTDKVFSETFSDEESTDKVFSETFSDEESTVKVLSETFSDEESTDEALPASSYKESTETSSNKESTETSSNKESLEASSLPETSSDREPSSTTEFNKSKPSEANSNSTYILLVILCIILVLLIVCVAAKRNRSTAVKNRRNNNDIESAQDVLAMDKKKLEKSVPNQVELIPLKPENHATDKRTNLANAEEPLLKKLSAAENENDQNGDKVKKTNEPQTETKQMNGNAKPLQNGLHDEKVKSNGTGDDHKKFQSISPKPSKYSPVYAHDTGRVKITVSETTRPKTPILVTRSRSNADDDKYENKISQ